MDIWSCVYVMSNAVMNIYAEVFMWNIYVEVFHFSSAYIEE